MARRLPTFLLAALCVASLTGCSESGENASPNAQQQGAAGVSQARQAVQQQYTAETVNATLRRRGGASLLEIVLVNPGGREGMNQQRARAVGHAARGAYGDALDTVRVSFEYSSQEGPAEVGFHRRYTFASSDLEGDAGGDAADATSPQP